jgi:16S rRNA (guanine527-N7)-methyltransferase
LSSGIGQRIGSRAAQFGLALTETTSAGLEKYFDLLRKWNDRVSLTALPIADATDESIDRLILEPCLAARYLSSATGRVIDVGSGGGSPAVPMKLMCPGISMLMVESRTRKAAFLREVVRQLSLSSTQVEAVRLEELVRHAALVGSADAVTIRAVRPDRKLLKVIEQLLKPGGTLLVFTSTLATDVQPSSHLFHSATQTLLPHLGSALHIFSRGE